MSRTKSHVAFGGVAVLLAALLTDAAESRPVIPMAQLPALDGVALLANIKTLASDAFEGRLPGTPGETRTVEFLVAEFKKLGLAPGNTDGTYVQKVPLVGITPKPTADLSLTKQGQSLGLKWRDDYVAWTTRVVDRTGLDGSELVFVGYGVDAPEYNWNDYGSMDLTGKTLVVLVGDPPVADPSNPSQLDPKTFGGRAMTYYGRWTYKYDIGAKKRAAGVLIVHQTAPAGYGWNVVQGNADESFNLRTPDRNMDRLAIEGWITVDSARKLFALAGQNFEALEKSASTRGFKPMPLGVSASMALQNALREVDSQNVLAVLPGSDPAAKNEYVVYSAHWDHLGVSEPIDGDRIYNGAVDNASGTSGMLEIARAFTKLPVPPRRSVLFLSVTAEEQGLLGAQYYAEHPIYPMAKTLANINMDGMNVHGRTSDVTVIGLGNSDLDDYLRQAAKEQGRTLQPDAEPEKGFYYRSDHFNFAKQGVPAMYIDEGTSFIGKPAGFGQKMRDEYTAKRYHRPQDEVLPSWDLSGGLEDLQLLFAVGLRVAEADKWPEWKPGTEFRAIREATLEKSGGLEQ